MMELVLIVTIFSAVYGISRYVPDLIQLARRRFSPNYKETSKEMNQLIKLTPKQIILTSVGVSALIGVMTQSAIIGGSLALVSLIMPKIVVSIVKSQRAKAFNAQLIDALLLLNNSLKSGLDMTAGIERISSTMKPPISEEFGVVLNAYRLGAALEDALMDMRKRINSKMLETVVCAIAIQRETGGNIIKTFDQLVITIREEDKLQRKVAALTAQGRTQIFFLAGFPWLLAGMFYVASPDMFRPAMQSNWGQFGMVFILIWEAIGVMVTKKIVSIDL